MKERKYNPCFSLLLQGSQYPDIWVLMESSKNLSIKGSSVIKKKFFFFSFLHFKKMKNKLKQNP